MRGELLGKAGDFGDVAIGDGTVAGGEEENDDSDAGAGELMDGLVVEIETEVTLDDGVCRSENRGQCGGQSTTADDSETHGLGAQPRSILAKLLMPCGDEAKRLRAWILEQPGLLLEELVIEILGVDRLWAADCGSQ